MDSLSAFPHPSIDPLTTVVEENAIRKLESYYCFVLDAREWSNMSKVFASDVVADYGPGLGVFNGVKQLADTLTKVLEPVTAQHSLGTQVITLEPSAGTDGKVTKASCLSYCVVSHFGKGEKEGKPLYAYVRYEDKLAKTQNEWRITNRTLTYMGPTTGDLSIFGVAAESYEKDSS